MAGVLNKIPIRKALREKGKSVCIISAVFFTTVLFVTVFSTMFFVMDAGEEMMREASPILSDAWLITTEEQYERICQNPLVSEAGRGIRIGSMPEQSGVGEILLFDFDEKMAQWLRYAPTEGRMPETDNEIVVSDQYLRERGLTYEADMPIEFTYVVADEEHTDIFIIVGIYDRARQPYHAVLASDDFYWDVCEQLEERGIRPKDSDNGIYQIAGIMFAPRGNVRRLASELIAEEGLDLEEGQIFLNDVSLISSVSAGTWAAIICLLVFVMATGYLFISNIFHLSTSGDARFYGKLATNGVTKKEIKKLIGRQNNILFLVAAIPALLAGYVFAAAILPGILNALTTIQIKRSGNPIIFVLSLMFSYTTMKVSERKPVKLAKNSSPIEMKRHMGKLKQVQKADNMDCLNKFVTRNFKSDKKKVIKVCASVVFSILLANAFYAAAAGFDEKEYVEENLGEDFIIAKKSMLTSPTVNSIFYERTTEEEIAEYRKLPGIKEEGGAVLSFVGLSPSQEIWDSFIRIMGENPYDTPGIMWTHAYGLDDIMVEKLKPIDGEIDPELFYTGNYVLLDPVMSDANVDNVACYKPGDEVTIPFRSGETGTYTVMAIVESLPYSLRFAGGGRFEASQLYLPMDEWQAKEKRNDYYKYTFDVEEEYHDLWEDTLESRLGGKVSALGYQSARTESRKAKGYITALKLAGFVLSVIMLSMGILNFINCMVGSIYSRRKEFAILQSMGMEEKEIKISLAKEGMLYMAGGLVPRALLSIPGVCIFLEKALMIPFIKYRFYPSIYLLLAVLGGFSAILVPWISYRAMDRREDFLTRIRACRE